MENDDADSEIEEDLLAFFEQELTLESSFPKICIPELDLTQMHISGKDRFFTSGLERLSAFCICSE